ncbi:MAG: transglycosylase SLT domain-containing protein [Bacteroidales bacterium]|nr:transglycosylase SLT domain-containing protein [Bacteroidales bacterium]
MTRRIKKILFYFILIFTLAAILPAIFITTRYYIKEDTVFSGQDTVRCAVALHDTPGGNLEAGFNYCLLKKYLHENAIDAEITISAPHSSWLDSLREGSVDLVITRAHDSLSTKGLIVSRIYDDSTAWYLRSNEKSTVQSINNWLSDLTSTDYYKKMRKAFMRRKTDLSSISPYDAIVKKYAGDIGWDWRLVSSVIYHESRFSINAESHRGAIGLMQIVPRRYPSDSLYDPETNIAVGTNYLRRLSSLFSDYAADSTECLKFTLAAFNAGEGRIQRYIEYAAAHDADTTRWDSVLAAVRDIPGSSSPAINAYVNSILETYYNYSRLYPSR